MLQSVHIRAFQSLHDVELDLSRFTVVVGPSSSGKSAFIRALHTLTNNRRGLDFLTHGERLMSIEATTERGTVILRRGKSTDDNDYTIIPTGDPQGQKRFTKLGGAVPEDVSQFLGIAPGPGPFAGQHDMPYMLNDSGSSVAQALGRLTNVDVIFSAARESKRQGLEASKTLKLRSDDLARIKEQLPRYAAVKGQLSNLALAEESIEAAYSAQQELNRITSARDTLTAAGSAVRTLTAASTGISAPDLSTIVEMHDELTRLTRAYAALQAAGASYKAAHAALAALETEQWSAAEGMAEVLSSLSSEFASRFTASPSSYTDADGSTFLEIEEAADIAAETVQGFLS